MGILYQELADTLARMIEQGIYAPGERIPGVRKLANEHAVSISTVIQAHQLLENRGVIEAKPRSGYYVRIPSRTTPRQPGLSTPSKRPHKITGQELAMNLSLASKTPGIIKLGAAIPDPAFLPTTAINRAIAHVTRLHANRSASYEFPPGSPELRTQISRRMQYCGCEVSPEEIVITSGCQEAITLALSVIAKPGDIIALESPTFYGLLQVVESLGMKALEIPTDPQSGISIDALKLALEQWPVKACVVVPNFNNPMGYCTSDNKKQKLVRLLTRHNVPLIEDDVYGDLSHQKERPLAAKHFDVKDNVIYCSSFSKTISPGLRVGWIIPGKYQAQIEYRKYISSLATPSLAQLALAHYLERGAYDKHLRQVRTQYHQLTLQFIHAINRYFPQGTAITQPGGGFVIWIELPEYIDTMELYYQAIENGISISPGKLFSATGKYKNFVRINCAHPWSARIESAIALLGRLAMTQDN